jgi:hypothetical protein
VSDFGEQIIYKQLLDRHGRIRIPMIQRDYAQGRPSEEEVREEFLTALESALVRPADDPSLPLNLDFIYGSVEGREDTRFSPLDGQQRLTTLFLLHWYLAWKDGCGDAFRALFLADGHSRFSYSVRPSSNEFFDALVAYQPACQPANVETLSCLITDQPWYFRSWRLDPTIQSALLMLDALHKRFAGNSGLFARLTSEKQPSITFQLLDLENFGLSDDLYIKMNARGKPLTPFETFKARYEQELARQFTGKTRCIGVQELPIAEFVARRMDTTWADLFWAHREKKTHLYDAIIMNVFRMVALVSRDPESKRYLKDVLLLRDGANLPSYSTFSAQGWLDEAFTRMLISLLETWSVADGFSKPLLPNTQYFDEKEAFAELIKDPTSLSLPEVILFSGYTLFIQEHESAIDPEQFQEWMRIVHNLAVNSYIERVEELRATARGLRELLPKSATILQHVSKLGAKDRVTGFADQQVKEETLKAGLILGDDDWKPLIVRAEHHGYFQGQIEFLCEFSGATEQWKSSGSLSWDTKTHRRLQQRFGDYLTKAEGMFTASGLADLGDSRWERALLSFGDYTLPSRSNWSFLVNSATEAASWKRFLRGTAPNHPEKRPLLKQLWDRLTTDRPFKMQLDEIIGAATALEPWIEAFVRTPEPLDYCGRQSIRWNSDTNIYLLSKSQMNGSHAELYTYFLHHNVLRMLDADGSLKPLKLSHYESVIGTDEEPYIRLNFTHQNRYFLFWIEFRSGTYYTNINRAPLDQFPELHALLCGSGGFADGPNIISKASAPDAIKSALMKLARLLSSLP